MSTASSLLSVGGLATGIDTKSLVSSLMSLERLPEKLLTAQQTAAQKQIDAFNLFSTSLTNLKGVVAGMNTAASFQSLNASVSDATVMTASASGSVSTGVHTIAVTSLATFERQLSNGYSSASDLNFNTGKITIGAEALRQNYSQGYASKAAQNFNTGTLKIAADPLRQNYSQGFASTSALSLNAGTFTITGGSSPLSVTLGPTNNSLDGMVKAINDLGGDVTASISNDGGNSPYHLLLNAKDSSKLGTYTIGAGSGLTMNSNVTEVAIDSTTNSLDGIIAEINKKTGSDVVASLGTDSTSSPYSLVLNAKDGSKLSQFTIDTSGLDGSGTGGVTGTYANPTMSSTVTTVSIGDTDNSLNGIAAAINKSGAKVTASVINGGSPSSPSYRLVLNGTDTNINTIDTSGLAYPTSSTGVLYDNPTFDKSAAAVTAGTYVAGKAASFSVDGVALTRSSNNVSDVIPGVTLNLLKEGSQATVGPPATKAVPATTTLSITNDTSTVSSRISTFVNAYNDAMGLFNKYSAYDTKAKTASVLAGDSTVRSLKSTLQSLIGSPVSGVNDSYHLLSQIGITSSSTDGTLSIDSTKLTAALTANPSAVSDLFTHNTGTYGKKSNEYGMAEQLNKQLDTFTHAYIGANSGLNGTIATRINGLQKKMTSIDDQVAAMERLMTQKESIMTKQFTAMETMVSNMSSGGWNSLLTTLSNMKA